MANNFTPMEQIISDALDDWALREHGLVLNQKNPALLVQILRTKELEIVKFGDMQKVRHEHKVITKELLEAYRTLASAKRRLEILSEEKDVLKEGQK